jgi:hypothetical protein
MLATAPEPLKSDKRDSIISSRWLGVPAAVLALTAGILVFATWPRMPAVSPQAIPTETSVSNADLNVVVLYQKQLSPEYGAEKLSTIELDVLPNVPVTSVVSKLTSSDGTLIEEIGDPTISQTATQETWVWPIVARHNGRIGPSNEDLRIDVRYQLAQPDSSPQSTTPQSLPVNFSILVNMQDFPVPFYIAMIATGIIASYALADGSKIVPRVVQQWGEIRRPIVWIVLSLVLTPIVYTQFRQTVGVLSDQQAIVALLLALPFGAGLDFGLSRAAEARA